MTRSLTVAAAQLGPSSNTKEETVKRMVTLLEEAECTIARHPAVVLLGRKVSVSRPDPKPTGFQAPQQRSALLGRHRYGRPSADGHAQQFGQSRYH